MRTLNHLHHIAGAAAIAALALPAVAHADSSVVGGPLKVRDYQMSVIGSDAGKDSLSIVFSRTSGGSTQQHMYLFDSGVTVTPTSIKGSLGRYGSIDLKLSGARSANSSVPAGCSGNPGSVKRGTLKGSLRFVADASYFRTVTAKSLPGTVSVGGSIRCDGATSGVPGAGTGAAGGPMLSLTKTDGGGMFTFSATPKQQSAMVMDDASATAPAQVMHMISAEGNGLKGDSVPGISPFIGGTGAFQGTVSGTLSGDLTAKFDSIGPVAIQGDATLMG
jgi:hypothetical protein